MTLNQNELNRYAQHLKLPLIGVEGQIKLKHARVLCVGAGGLGSSLLLYLSAAGVGNIGVIDNDVIELSNLHRQVLYRELHVRQKKVLVAKEQLLALNASLNIEVFPERLTLKNIEEIIASFDIVADCSDNFETRYLINDVCFKVNKPYVFASATQLQGQCTFFLGSDGPCLRCLFPVPLQEETLLDCNLGGVLGMLPGLLGIIQATEIIKYILQLDGLLWKRLLTVDIAQMQFQEFLLQKDPECHFCSFSMKSSLKKNNDAQFISVSQLQALLQASETIVLLDVRTEAEHVRYNLGGILIPLAELSTRYVELDKNKNIIIYCQSDMRSKQAIGILLKAGFKKLSYLQGGIVAWQNNLAARRF